MIPATLLTLACATPPPQVQVTAEANAVQIHSDTPLERVRLLDEDGGVVQTRRLPAPTRVLSLPIDGPAGAVWTVEAQTTTGPVSTPFTLPSSALSVRVAAPAGQDARAVRDGDTVRFVQVGDTPVDVAFTARAPQAGTVRLVAGARQTQGTIRVPGDHAVLHLPVRAPQDVVIAHGDDRIRLHLAPLHRTLAQARRALELRQVRLPTGANGQPDPARPEGRITLPSRWWQALLHRWHLGFRPSDSSAPWGYMGVTLTNHDTTALNVVVRARVLDGDGQPDPAFRPRMRDVDDGTGQVSVLLRVPPDQPATAVLPIFVHDPASDPARTLEVSVSALGQSEALHTLRRPLPVHRASAATSAGMVGVLLGALAGWGLVIGRGRGWLRRTPTSELATVALFGALLFAASAAAQLVAIVSSALLGPFSPLAVGLVDESFRFALLATLVTLLPRPGVVGTAILITTGMRAMTLGGFTPIDLLGVGAGIAWHEGALWLTGLTRGGGAWRAAPARQRWLRLWAGFSLSSVLGLATMLVNGAVFYRLFYADWYVAMLLIAPGFAYVGLACWLAVPFADALRRVEE